MQEYPVYTPFGSACPYRPAYGLHMPFRCGPCAGVPGLQFYKCDAETGAGLPGAVFELRCSSGRAVASAISDLGGMVRFPRIFPGQYTLVEIAPPPGYVRLPYAYCVNVEADGGILIDGIPACRFQVGNSKNAASFSATKTDATTGRPLPGAVFELQQNGRPVCSTISDAAGVIAFSGLAPGAYSLIETQPPAGYQPTSTVHTVVVAPDTTVTVDGQPAANTLFPNEPFVPQAREGQPSA